MFFSIHHQDNQWHWSSDPGWHQYGNIWAKGYAHNMTLDQVVQQYDFDQPPTITGNFCLVKIDSTGISIGHSRDRNFPLWVNNNSVSNLYQSGEQIWADTLLKIDNQKKLHLKKIKIPGALEQTLTLEEVTDNIINLVSNQVQNFLLHNRLPVNIFRSGGLDTAFLYSIVRSLDIKHTEWHETIIEPNDFIENNKSALSKFWAYKQIHHWNHPNIILTGSHGDEYFLRGPTVISMIMAWHDIDFIELLKLNPDAYHSWYFLKPENYKIFEYQYNNRKQLQEQYPTWINLANQIINILANDYQYLHLGQTLTWTPQKDLDIARWALCLPLEDLIQNSLHGTLIKGCIQQLWPAALIGVTKHKNRFS